MDILFPWRKQPQKQQQHPHPLTPQDPYYHHGGNTTFGGGGGNEQYHSLPHPQEHMLQLHQSRGGLRSRSSGSGGGGGGYGGGMTSQVSEISGPSSSSHHGLHQQPRDHGNVVTDTGRTRGGGTTRPSTRVQRQQRKQRQQLHQHQHHRMTGASSEFSKLFPSTDESDRSLGSDLTDPTTRAAANGSSSGMRVNNGVGNPRRPSLQSRDTATSLPSYQASTTTTPFLPPPPPPPPEYDDNDDDILLAPIMAVSPVRQLLDVINMSILPSSLRLASLTQAMEFLDHRDKNMHDAELREEGVAFVLYQKLGLALQFSRCCDVVVYELGGGGGGGGSGSVGNGSSTNKWDKRRPSLGGVSVGSGSTQQSSSHPHSFDVALAMQRQLELDKEIVMICS